MSNASFRPAGMPAATMSTASTPPAPSICPRCGRTTPADAILGACPICLLAAGFASEPAASNSAPPPRLAEIAPEFPQLELLEPLGRGGMGAVYKARQRSLDRLVALKLLRPGLDADPTFAERFTREARALAGLNHPGIVTLYEFGRTPGGLFFILMEYVDGVNLRQLLAAGRLAPREALAIIPPLCDALQYAHDRGLVHRDIKPENILVDRLGRVKVADFGLAKLAAQPDATVTASSAPASKSDASPRHDLALDLTEAGKVIGTPRYMAPEQRERPNDVDHRADIYALGVVLYQMLTGELPDTEKLQPPSRRVQLDVRLDEIVLRALEKEPSQRYQHASAMKTQLELANGLSAAPKASGTSFPDLKFPRGELPRELVVAAISLMASPFLFQERDWGIRSTDLIAIPIGISLLLRLSAGRICALTFLAGKILTTALMLTPIARIGAQRLNEKFGFATVFPELRFFHFGGFLLTVIFSILIWTVLHRPAIKALFSRTAPQRTLPWILTFAAAGIVAYWSLRNAISISLLYFEASH